MFGWFPIFALEESETLEPPKLGPTRQILAMICYAYFRGFGYVHMLSTIHLRFFKFNPISHSFIDKNMVHPADPIVEFQGVRTNTPPLAALSSVRGRAAGGCAWCPGELPGASY